MQPPILATKAYVPLPGPMARTSRPQRSAQKPTPTALVVDICRKMSMTKDKAKIDRLISSLTVALHGPKARSTIRTPEKRYTPVCLTTRSPTVTLATPVCLNTLASVPLAPASVPVRSLAQTLTTSDDVAACLDMLEAEDDTEFDPMALLCTAFDTPAPPPPEPKKAVVTGQPTGSFQLGDKFVDRLLSDAPFTPPQLCTVVERGRKRPASAALGHFVPVDCGPHRSQSPRLSLTSGSSSPYPHSSSHTEVGTSSSSCSPTPSDDENLMPRRFAPSPVGRPSTGAGLVCTPELKLITERMESSEVC